MKFRSLLSLVMVVVCTSVLSAGETFRVAEPTAEALQLAQRMLRELRDGGDRAAAILELPAGILSLEEPLQLTPREVGDGLTIRGDKNGGTVLSGAVPLATAGKNASGHWCYSIPEDVTLEIVPRLLMIAGEMRSAARYPNTGYLRIEKAFEDRRSGFTVAEGDLPAGFQRTADSADTVADLVLLHDWSSSRLPIASYDPQTRELRTVGPIGCEAKHYAIDHFEKQPRYWLEGHPAFADQPGEWYLDRAARQIVLVARPDAAEPPAVLFPRLEQLLAVTGDDAEPVTNVTIEGITFSGGKFPMPAGGLGGAQATMHEPRDATGQRTTRHRPMLGAAVEVNRADRVRIRNCRFDGNGATGLWLGRHTTNSEVFRCHFIRLGGNGLNLGEDNARQVDGKPWYQGAPDQISRNNRITECEVSFCGQVLPGSVGIWAPLNRELSIANNYLHDLPYTGISLGWMWNPTPTPAGENRIVNNKIEFVMQILSDGAGIYTLGNQPGTVLEGNVIADVPLNAGRAESNGIFCDEGTTGLTIRDNTIRRIDRSPVRFHKAGENSVTGNRWELATPETPPVRFNNTPEKNIAVSDNETLSSQKRIFLIGNSLTWDTVPSRLDEAVHWHVDCGKPLPYIYANPGQPCVKTSRLWPVALTTTQYDLLSLQPHYGSTLEEDIATISRWLALQPRAIVIIHTGWARHESAAEEYADTDPAGPLTHSPAYFDALLKRLGELFPDREFRTTGATQLLHRIQQDIDAGRAPLSQLENLYRDAVHMQGGPGRYLMHNQMRKTLGQPKLETGFPEFDPRLKAYLDQLLDEQG